MAKEKEKKKVIKEGWCSSCNKKVTLNESKCSQCGTGGIKQILNG